MKTVIDRREEIKEYCAKMKNCDNCFFYKSNHECFFWWADAPCTWDKNDAKKGDYYGK